MKFLQISATSAIDSGAVAVPQLIAGVEGVWEELGACELTGVSELVGVWDETGVCELTGVSELVGAWELDGVCELTGVSEDTGVSEETGACELTRVSEEVGVCDDVPPTGLQPVKQISAAKDKLNNFEMSVFFIFFPFFKTAKKKLLYRWYLFFFVNKVILTYTDNL